jgi:bacterioferritin
MTSSVATEVKPQLNQKIIDELTRAYWMEMETVQNYLANSTNAVGVRAEEIKESLAEDVGEELDHARALAKRIHVLGGHVPGSMEFRAEQHELQPPENAADIVGVIRGVIEAETRAIEQYRKIINMCEGADYVTQDVCIDLLGAEEEHRRQFAGFLTEYEG